MTKPEEIIQQANDILRKKGIEDAVQTADGMIYKDRQVCKIVRIAKYKFHWKRKTIFDKILEFNPELAELLFDEDKRFHKTSSLYRLMSKEQKSHFIKFLEQIEKTNERRSEQDE